MEIVFWGSRGSVPCFSKQKVHFGTNTSCLEVQAAGNGRIIFDAGTGIVSLGTHLEKAGIAESEVFHIFFTHFHWDHIQGLPFFKPMYNKRLTVVLYGQPGIESVFSQQMMAPFFPLPFEALPAKIILSPMKEAVELGDMRITPFPLHHPQGCYGYVVERDGKRFVHATDCEPDGGEMDQGLLSMAGGADLLVMDSNNTPDEAKHRKGWGHSTWEDCCKVAAGAGAKRLVLFHHDPFHDDEAVQDKQRQAQKVFPNSICSYEGLRIRLD